MTIGNHLLSCSCTANAAPKQKVTIVKPAKPVKAAVPLVPVAFNALHDDELTCNDVATKQKIRDLVFPKLKDDMTYVAIGILKLNTMFTFTFHKNGLVLGQPSISTRDKCYNAVKDVIDGLKPIR